MTEEAAGKRTRVDIALERLGGLTTDQLVELAKRLEDTPAGSFFKARVKES